MVAEFLPWLRAHRGSLAMAGLLSVALPAHFFAGTVSVMRDPTVEVTTLWALWCVLLGALLWCSLLVVGYALQRLDLHGRWSRWAAMLLGACIAGAFADFGSSGRASLALEQGVVHSTGSMLAYAFVFCSVTALLYFARLERSRIHEEAAARLASAQAEQRQVQQRLAQARLQALQARVDPQLLLEMLDAVRGCYETDPPRAERLLDELILFLRASLPRLRDASSSLAREAELARAYTQLRALADAADIPFRLGIEADAAGACFPPGVLLPLLADTVREGPGGCALSALRAVDRCRVVLTLPAAPSAAALAKVRSALADVYGASAQLAVDTAGHAAAVTMELPYEPA